MKRLLAVVAALALFGVIGAGQDAKAQGWDSGPRAGDFQVRILGAGVLPDEDLTALRANGGPDISAGNGVDISDEVIPAATLTYFFTSNVAAELFCCFATHDIEATGNISALGEIADFWIFPPTVTLQYHFSNMGRIKPYVGAGFTYIHFFDESGGQSAGDAVFDGAQLTDTEIDDAFGLALQAGVDVSLGGGWSLNADVKKVFIDTDATWRFDDGSRLDAEVDIDPWIISAGIGYRFNLFGHRRMEPLK